MFVSSKKPLWLHIFTVNLVVIVTLAIDFMGCGGGSESGGLSNRAQGWKKEDTRNQWGDVDGYRYIQTVRSEGKNANVDNAKWNLSIAYYSATGSAAVIIEGESLVPIRGGDSITISLRDADGDTHDFRGVVSAQHSIKERLFIESNRRMARILARNTQYRVLVEGGDWHVRADIAGGLPVVTVTHGSFTDSRNDKTYRTVRIGNQTWMAENLNFESDNSWCYNNDPINCKKYGRLYTWAAAREACPIGWRLPTAEDWEDLYDATDDGENIAGTNLKASVPDWDGIDDFGFSALPGGYRYAAGSFGRLGDMGYWWTAEYSANVAYWVRMLTGRSGLQNSFENKNGGGISVRCVQN